MHLLLCASRKPRRAGLRRQRNNSSTQLVRRKRPTQKAFPESKVERAALRDGCGRSDLNLSPLIHPQYVALHMLQWLFAIDRRGTRNAGVHIKCCMWQCFHRTWRISVSGHIDTQFCHTSTILAAEAKLPLTNNLRLLMSAIDFQRPRLLRQGFVGHSFRCLHIPGFPDLAFRDYSYIPTRIIHRLL